MLPRPSPRISLPLLLLLAALSLPLAPADARAGMIAALDRVETSSSRNGGSLVALGPNALELSAVAVAGVPVTFVFDTVDDGTNRSYDFTITVANRFATPDYMITIVPNNSVLDAFTTVRQPNSFVLHGRYRVPDAGVLKPGPTNLAFTVAAVPEPSGLSLAALGSLSLLGLAHRRRRLSRFTKTSLSPAA